MRFRKHYLADIFKCYAVSSVKINGETNLIFAGEGKDAGMYVFSGKNFDKKTTIWENSGGTMSISPLPEKDGYFLASKGFVSMVEAQESHVVIVRYKNGSFSYEKIADLPYLHRFDLLTGEDGTKYFLGATIADYKENKEDWSHPGKLYVSEFPEDLDSNIKLELDVIKDGLTINHGYCKGIYDGVEAGYIGAKEGMFVAIPPKVKGGSWQVEQIMDTPISDMAVIDIDGDGELEIATISPFHGDRFNIYKKINGEYKIVYSYPVYQNFYHTVVSCTLKGKPAFVGGARRNRMQLFVITYDKDKEQFISSIVDEGVGPSNSFVVNENDREIILSANRQIGHATAYYVE
ncbi:MAG: hypothetical protein GY750_14555 [Lentisphaerae bacterium]|nr:hypothetical protein [Lentisphaerota bacterium]MCP4102623.1 hypothetical protein [Lentisphaerota bacterium]